MAAQDPCETTAPDLKPKLAVEKKKKKKRHWSEDFTSEINLNKGVQVQTGSWETQRHKHGVLSYQAVAFMGEMESLYLHCWLSYKVYKNADLCDVCFVQRV